MCLEKTLLLFTTQNTVLREELGDRKMLDIREWSGDAMMNGGLRCNRKDTTEKREHPVWRVLPFSCTLG